MFATVVAVMCKLVVAHATIAPVPGCTAEEMSVEEVVTDTDKDPQVDLAMCRMNVMISLSEWKSNHPIYFKDEWRISAVKCVAGHYRPRSEI